MIQVKNLRPLERRRRVGENWITLGDPKIFLEWMYFLPLKIDLFFHGCVLFKMIDKNAFWNVIEMVGFSVDAVLERQGGFFGGVNTETIGFVFSK